MVVKQAIITSYKVSDPSDILDRRPVKPRDVLFEYHRAVVPFC